MIRSMLQMAPMTAMTQTTETVAPRPMPTRRVGALRLARLLPAALSLGTLFALFALCALSPAARATRFICPTVVHIMAVVSASVCLLTN